MAGSSPPTASQQPGFLEHPSQAIDYYRKKGIGLLSARQMVHGTPVIIVLCRNAAEANRRFQLKGEGIGTVYTRSGRPYFDDSMQEQTFLLAMSNAMEASDLWSLLKTEWICLEAVAAPLAAKSPSYIADTYTNVSITGMHALSTVEARLAAAKQRGLPVEDLLMHNAQTKSSLAEFARTFQKLTACQGAQIIWQLHQVAAVEDQVLLGQSQTLQQALLEQIATALGTYFVATKMLQADLDSEDSLRAITAWWELLNANGQPGILVGPMEMRAKTEGEIAQPWIKVRCKEYLRLLFGPAYDAPASLQVLRERNLRMLRETAVREYALTRDALDRFVSSKEFDAVYQCTMTALGLELTMIDPRW